MSLPFDSAKQLRIIADLYRADEAYCVDRLIPAARLSAEKRRNAKARAKEWTEEIRRTHRPQASVTDLLSRFGLTSQEGLALMCLAEALLRIPDRATTDALIRDKLNETHWNEALGADAPWALNVTGWALSITGKIIQLEDPTGHSPGASLGRLVSRLGQPVIREAIRQAMQWLADQFVMGQDIGKAIQRARPSMERGVRFSFDMLGEGARTHEDAERYYHAYTEAIDELGNTQAVLKFPRPSGISVKLSALHPRYEITQRERVIKEMVPKLVALCEQAARHDIPLTIDAEECDRLHLSLEVAAALLETANLRTWEGLGFAVQAYQKRAPAVIDFLVGLASAHKRKIHIRLVKGAYWDSEIKRAQERGLEDFPVFTRKAATDTSYLACAQRMLAAGDAINPIFGTHNAMTVAHLIEIVGHPNQIEFQRLHGMGDDLYHRMQEEDLHCCVYAPVGDHNVLLGYLVRRILENGANSSFVHKLLDRSVSIEELTADPVDEILSFPQIRHPRVRMPADLYMPERRNSKGLELHDPFVTRALFEAMEPFSVAEPWTLESIDIDKTFDVARVGYKAWSQEPLERRAMCLEKLGDLLEENRAQLMALMIDEGGKTVSDALSEVREATDFCRYYAMRAQEDLKTLDLPGPTGEQNQLHFAGRGIFVSISPWNFPLAIFLGQAVAALVSGNAVIAKPAPQTPRIAAFATSLIYEAGISSTVFHLAPGGGDVGAALVAHRDVAGVAFTGSTSTGRAINRALAAKDGPIVPLIAETGGQNAMIVDSSALPEQVIDDVLTSAFRSAGQRCSALRVLCLPDATAQSLLTMLKGAMRELRVGDPRLLETDVGPVIDEGAQKRLFEHVLRLKREAKEIYTTEIASHAEGTFVAPQAWEIPSLGWLSGEVFGPVLHVVRYKPEALDALINEINAMGFGLTGGLHSRIEGTMRQVERTLNVGNIYINRSMIGAVVGSQPFGGEGLSGTGPKAGGPHYLTRFTRERVTSRNTTAAGGNASLLMAVSK